MPFFMKTLLNQLEILETLKTEDIDHSPVFESILQTCDLDVYTEFSQLFKAQHPIPQYLSVLYAIAKENLKYSDKNFKFFYESSPDAIDPIFA